MKNKEYLINNEDNQQRLDTLIRIKNTYDSQITICCLSDYESRLYNDVVKDIKQLTKKIGKSTHARINNSK